MMETLPFLWSYLDYVGPDLWRVAVSHDDQDVGIDDLL